MIEEAGGSPRCPSIVNVMDVPLPDANEDILMLVTRMRMHPSCLIFVCLLKKCIGDDKLVLSECHVDKTRVPLVFTFQTS